MKTCELELLRLRLKVLEARLNVLASSDKEASLDPVERVKAHIARCISAKFRWVEPSYYNKTLSERARIVGCNVYQLTKTLIFSSIAPQKIDGSINANYVMVIVQYTARITLKLLEEVVNRHFPTIDCTEKRHFSMTSDKVAFGLTGLPYNGICPFGSKLSMPVILCSAIANLPQKYFWMGGGHPNLKIGLSVKDFVAVLHPVIADISEQRDLSE